MITNASPFYVCLAQTTTPALVCTVEMQHLSVAAATVEWMGRADPTVQIAQVVNAGGTEALRYACSWSFILGFTLNILTTTSQYRYMYMRITK